MLYPTELRAPGGQLTAIDLQWVKKIIGGIELRRLRMASSDSAEQAVGVLVRAQAGWTVADRSRTADPLALSMDLSGQSGNPVHLLLQDASRSERNEPGLGKLAGALSAHWPREPVSLCKLAAKIAQHAN